MRREIPGQLEIDHGRGVIYFHTTDPKLAAACGSVTILRICHVPKPIPENKALDISLPDSAMEEFFHTNW